MIDKFASLLGPNWQPRISGLLAVIFYLISNSHKSFTFLDEKFIDVITNMSGLASSICVIIYIFTTKSANVTGGKVPATPEAEERLNHDHKNI